MSHNDSHDKAAVVLCLGFNPHSLDKTMDSLTVCSGILDYFRAIHGRGYIMTINFSGTRLLQAKTPEEAGACIREECLDWKTVLDRAVERINNDAPASCKYVEVVLVGTDEVPSKIKDSAELCRGFRTSGVRINSILVEASSASEGPAPEAYPSNSGWTVLDHSPTSQGSWYEEEDGWGMIRIARETGGLTLSPNTEGKLAIHQLFSEMFRRWGEDYWKAASADTKRRGA